MLFFICEQSVPLIVLHTDNSNFLREWNVKILRVSCADLKRFFCDSLADLYCYTSTERTPMDLNEECSDAWSQKSAEWRVVLKISRTND